MSEDFVQLPVDGTGKKMRTIKKTVGANEVHEEVQKQFDGRLTYSDVDTTKVIIGRDAEGYINLLSYYNGSTLLFTLTVTRDVDKNITGIERS